ncbi:MAG: Tm-1-like ATP-binding domain-containing protein [Sphaerochaetaceae bacterium]
MTSLPIKLFKKQLGIDAKELYRTKNKGECIDTIIAGTEKMTKRLFDEGKIDAVLGLGGAQGTAISTAAMRTLPFGVPKFMVTTVSFGNGHFWPVCGNQRHHYDAFGCRYFRYQFRNSQCL